ncbi:MAG: hypothetical protein L6R42_009372 [Xanthoria sp. 1 TBL-2021]|nr:MAG: hypothetical protein L6R42_009372 [Xanthoria sp. 1 TBL-2021]
MPGYPVHTMPSIWGPDVESFNPHRFMKIEKKSKEKSPKQHPASFRTFGGGATLCPGRHFATAELCAATAMMVMRFDLEPVDNGGVWVIPRYEYGRVASAVPPPDSDVKVRIKTRKGMEEVSWRFGFEGSVSKFEVFGGDVVAAPSEPERPSARLINSPLEHEGGLPTSFQTFSPQSTKIALSLTSLLLALAPFLFAFPTSTNALPPPPPKISATSSSTPLVRRGGETVRYEWDENPKHRGTLHCFTTGTFTTASFISRAAAIRSICGYYSLRDNATSFTYEPLANGTYPHQYIRLGSPIGKSWVGFEDVLWYDMQLQGRTHAGSGECQWAIEKVVSEGGGCPWGGNTGKASQGGWFRFEDDGTTFGVDPTFESLSGRARSEGQ